MLGIEKRNKTVIVNHLKTVLGDPQKEDFRSKKDELLLKVVWVGLLTELIPEISLPEYKEVTGYTSHSNILQLKSKWYKLDWRVRYSWLCFVESAAIDLDWSSVIREYSNNLEAMPQEVRKHCDAHLTRSDLLRQWQNKQTRERWKDMKSHTGGLPKK